LTHSIPKKGQDIVACGESWSVSEIKLNQQLDTLGDWNVSFELGCKGLNFSALTLFNLERLTIIDVKSKTTGKLVEQLIRVKQITCEDLDELAKVRKVKVAVARKIPERKFKYGIAKLAKQSGNFDDWGGEANDLYTSKIHVRGRRYAMAFAFKGPATTGKLTPKKLGKNGDQIQRLFGSPADVFFVQYHDQIDESVVEQMKRFAIAASVTENKLVMFGVIDGDETNRLIAAYPKAFEIKD